MNEWISRRRSSVDITCISSISMNEWMNGWMNEWISRRRSSVDTTCISSISMNEWMNEYLGEDLV